MQVLRWLLAAQGFEQFLSRKFPASKRFGLEGCEALLPGLLALVEAGAESGLRKVRYSACSFAVQGWHLTSPQQNAFACCTRKYYSSQWCLHLA
jgi:hypothetical protein